MQNILVSIYCTAYNHEKYIADAINSFLAQQTNFKYEILIHDDASTDRTADIIREYEKQYPDLIKPIYQTENQYSKVGITTVDTINFDRALGKYIAVCEGDDYWTDQYKLQKQIDYMESHPECSLCVHAGYVVSAVNKKKQDINRPNKGDKSYTVEEVIEGGGGLFLTNSMLFPTRFGKIRPAFLENAPVGDYPLAINLSLQGKVHYIDEFMSAYRVGNSESWTGKINSDIKKNATHFREISTMLDELNEYTNYQYKDAIHRTKENNELYVLLIQRKFNEVKKGKYKEIYLRLEFKRKLIIFIDQYSPSIANFFRNRRRWISWVLR